MPEYTGKIEYSNEGSRYIPAPPPTVSYTHSADDIVIVSAGPDSGNNVDNVKISLEYDSGNGWNVIVSDSSYTGAVFFRIVYGS